MVYFYGAGDVPVEAEEFEFLVAAAVGAGVERSGMGEKLGV
jgi:hypothetical protein